MTSKDESIFTQERILSISGSKANCVKCLSMVVSKLASDPELSQFANKGTSFSTTQGFDPRSSAGGRGGRGGRSKGSLNSNSRSGSLGE